jgi:hypothetical protein
LIRTDATVNFDWGYGSPATGIGSDTFSARWTGKVQPRYTETYTFYSTYNDAARLWVNGQLLLSNWNDSEGTSSGTNVSSYNTVHAHISATIYPLIIRAQHEYIGYVGSHLSIASSFIDSH